MEATIEYLLKTSLIWTFGLLWYRFFLRRQSKFAANRFFLLAFLLLAPLVFCLPVWWLIEEKIYSYNLAGIAVSVGTQALAEPLRSTWALWLILLLSGIALGLLRLALSLWQLRQLLQKAKKQSYEGQWLLRMPDSSDSYTFFGYVVVGDLIPDQDLPCIVAHEKAHQHLRHSRDVILAELCSIFFWFHPLVYLYKYYLRELHEFQADRAVLQHFSIRNYADLLLQRAMNTRVSLFHNFSNQSQLKNRLTMMTKMNVLHRQSWAYWVAMPLVFLVLLMLNVQNVSAQVTDQPDVMPLYGDCAAAQADAQANCSMQNLMTALVGQIKYPETAAKSGKEGKVFVEFVVAKNGKVQDAKVIKSVDTELDAEALRVVNSLKSWTAGEKGGKKVNVKMVLPIAFKL